MGPNGLFYANAVGAFGAVSTGRNWDLLASAANRWALKLADWKEIPILLFPGDALVLAESETFEEHFLEVIFP